MSRSVGLRTEILITLSLLLGAALLFGGLVMLRFTESSLLEERVQQLDAFTNLLADSISMSGAENVHLDESHMKALSAEGINCRVWRIYNQDLVLIDQWQATGEEGLESQFQAALKYQSKVSGRLQRFVDFPTLLNIFNHSEPKVQFIIPLEFNKDFIGLMELSYSLNDIRFKLLQSQWLILIYVILYGLVLVGAGYFLILRNIIRPAGSLLIATNAVGQGNLENRLLVDGPLEISQLAVAFNKMVEALQSSRNETESQIAILEETNKQLEQTKNELVRREKMASVGQLAAGLAHELGNPLAALIGYLELLRQRVEQSADKDLIARSLAETKRIDFLVRELLDFSRPDRQQQLEVVDPVVVLNDSVELLNNQGTMTGITIVSNLPDVTAAVLINRNKLQQIFVNLLLNGVQACSNAGTITLDAGCSTDNVWLSIGDNGCGIADDALKRIFDPFYTTKDPGMGTGLGLAMCQRIIEEVGGDMSVESKLTQGSVFTVKLMCNNCSLK